LRRKEQKSSQDMQFIVSGLSYYLNISFPKIII